MSQENVELAWQASHAWNDSGLTGLIAYLDPAVEWHPPVESMEPGIDRGHEGVRDYLGRLGEIFEDRRVEPLEVIDVDDQRVISVVRVIAKSSKFDMEINADWAWLITVGSNKKGIRVDMFTAKSKALQAAGLSE